MQAVAGSSRQFNFTYLSGKLLLFHWFYKLFVTYEPGCCRQFPAVQFHVWETQLFLFHWFYKLFDTHGAGSSRQFPAVPGSSPAVPNCCYFSGFRSFLMIYMKLSRPAGKKYMKLFVPERHPNLKNMKYMKYMKLISPERNT